MAMVDEEELEQPAEVVVTKGKSRLRLVIAAVVGLLVLGGAVWGVMAMRGQPASAATGKGASNAKAGASARQKLPEYYLPLDPAFVVNFRDDDSLRYLQVGVTLMSHDQAALDTAKQADPVVRDALVKLFSSRDYSILSDAKGKQQLQADALAAVRRIVRQRYGKPGIDALYFTSFVMQ